MPKVSSRFQGIDAATITNNLISIVAHEAEALHLLTQQFPQNAYNLVELMLTITGKVIFSGIGKSGLIAQKLAATASSLGIPAIFLHPQDALHGDLGAIQKNDLFIVLSKSGSGTDFEYILPLLKAQNIPTCLICCHHGILNTLADMAVVLPFKNEACTLNLAPTSSSTTMLAFGDALAVVTSTLKGFNKNDFARYHPAGDLGKRLLLNVATLMHKSNALPFIYPDASFQELLITITSKKLGVGIVVDTNNHLLGFISDGDLRRACNQGPAVFEKKAADIMISNPKSIPGDMLACKALEIMEAFNITSLIVVEGKTVIGLLHIHDLIKAGIRGE